MGSPLLQSKEMSPLGIFAPHPRDAMGGAIAQPPNSGEDETLAEVGRRQQGATASAVSSSCGSVRVWVRRWGCMFVFLHVVLILVWPPITVLALHGMLSKIDGVSEISDVQDVPFSPTTCELVASSTSASQECCTRAVVGSARGQDRIPQIDFFFGRA
jgi:hypothetical protein